LVEIADMLFGFIEFLFTKTISTAKPKKKTGDMNPNGQNLRREWHPHYLTLENQPRVIIAIRRNWKKKKMIDAINNFKTSKLQNPPHLTQKEHR
jgi:hypothetical protein